MKKEFFEGTRPASIGKNGELELPILYYRDDTFFSYFTADYEKVKSALPTDKLEPIRVTKSRCVIGLGVFNYLHTTIGSYGEFIIAIPALFDKKPFGPLPLLRQSLDPAFGMYVLHCCVTSQAALKGGRDEWNYPKFITDMHFESNGKFMQCDLSSDGQKIMDVRVEKRGIIMRDNKPLVSLLNQGGNLIRDSIGSTGISESSINTSGAFLKVYPGHPMAEDWLRLGPSPRPFMTKVCNSHFAILPKGTILESGIIPYDGHRFENGGKDGHHTISYNGTLFNLENSDAKSTLCSTK